MTIAALIIIEVRGRRRRRKMQAEVPPLWVSVVRTGILVAVTLVATYLFGAGPVGTSVPIVAIILGVLTIIYGFITKNTIFGRQVYAVGGNASAAVLSGVSARKVNFFVMANMSVLAAVAGMVFVGYSNASVPPTAPAGSSTRSRPCSSVAPRSPAASAPSPGRSSVAS